MTLLERPRERRQTDMRERDIDALYALLMQDETRTFRANSLRDVALFQAVCKKYPDVLSKENGRSSLRVRVNNANTEVLQAMRTLMQNEKNSIYESEGRPVRGDAAQEVRYVGRKTKNIFSHPKPAFATVASQSDTRDHRDRTSADIDQYISQLEDRLAALPDGKCIRVRLHAMPQLTDVQRQYLDDLTDVFYGKLIIDDVESQLDGLMTDQKLGKSSPGKLPTDIPAKITAQGTNGVHANGKSNPDSGINQTSALLNLTQGSSENGNGQAGQSQPGLLGRVGKWLARRK